MEPQVNAVIQDFIAAELRRDNTALTPLLTNDFQLVGPAGFVLGKGEWLGSLASGDLQLSALILEDIKIRVYETSALAIGTRKQTGSYQNRDVQGEFRETLMLIRQGAQWQLAGVHLSAVAAGR